MLTPSCYRFGSGPDFCGLSLRFEERREFCPRQTLLVDEVSLRQPFNVSLADEQRAQFPGTVLDHDFEVFSGYDLSVNPGADFMSHVYLTWVTECRTLECPTFGV